MPRKFRKRYFSEIDDPDTLLNRRRSKKKKKKDKIKLENSLNSSEVRDGMPSVSVPAQEKPTLWSHDYNGDVDIPEICLFSLQHCCIFEDKGCSRLHSKCTCHWQFMYRSSWINFREFHSKELENAYEDVSKNGVELSPLIPERLRDGCSVMLTILGKHQWEADFETMTLTMKNSQNLTLIPISYQIRRLSTQSAAILNSTKATTFEWYYLDINNKWNKYGEPDSTKYQSKSSLSSSDIEKHYMTNKSMPLMFSTSRFQYSLNLETMLQINLTTDNVRPVRRRPIKRVFKNSVYKWERPKIKVSSEENLPDFWSDMKDTSGWQLVTLKSSSSEYQDVETNFLVTVPSVRVLSIMRVQNPSLWKVFQKRKKELSLRYGSEEKLDISKLFHGTREDYWIRICYENFDQQLQSSVIEPNYGRGVYFTDRAVISKDYSVPNASGIRAMFVSEVIVGETTIGNSCMSQPPRNPDTGELYDTTVDDVSVPSIFVKYDRRDCYPLYVIMFME